LVTVYSVIEILRSRYTSGVGAHMLACMRAEWNLPAYKNHRCYQQP